MTNNASSTPKKTPLRYDQNPYVVGLEIPLAKKKIQVNPLGKEGNVLVNLDTGESQGTHISTYRKVDAEQFVKIFTSNIALTFDLKSAGIKAFNVLLWTLRQGSPNKDLVALDKYALEDFLKKHDKKLSQSTFMRGLVDLEDAKILAKNIRKGWYYINPNFVFSGDRIAFTTIIEREKDKHAKSIEVLKAF